MGGVSPRVDGLAVVVEEVRGRRWRPGHARDAGADPFGLSNAGNVLGAPAEGADMHTGARASGTYEANQTATA